MKTILSSLDYLISASDLKYLTLTKIKTIKPHVHIPKVYIVLIHPISIFGVIKSIVLVEILNTKTIKPAETPSGNG